MVQTVSRRYQLEMHAMPSLEELVSYINQKLDALYWYIRLPIVGLSFLFWLIPLPAQTKYRWWKRSSLPLLASVIRFYESLIVMRLYDRVGR